MQNLVRSDPQWATQPFQALQREFARRNLSLYLYAVPTVAQGMIVKLPHSELLRRNALRVHIGTRDDWMQFRTVGLGGLGDAELTARLADAGFEMRE